MEELLSEINEPSAANVAGDYLRIVVSGDLNEAVYRVQISSSGECQLMVAYKKRGGRWEFIRKQLEGERARRVVELLDNVLREGHERESGYGFFLRFEARRRGVDYLSSQGGLSGGSSMDLLINSIVAAGGGFNVVDD